MKNILISLILLPLAGCALLQSSSQIKYNGATLTLPKDAKIGYLELKANGYARWRTLGHSSAEADVVIGLRSDGVVAWRTNR